MKSFQLVFYYCGGLVFTQVWGYAKVWVLGRFWLRLGPRFGGAADPGFTPRFRGFGANPENPPWGYIFFICLVPPLSRPLAIEPPALDLQRGEPVVEVGERGGVEVRIVRRRTIVREGTLPPGGGAVVRRGPAHPSQVLHDVPRSGRSAQSGFSSRVSGLGNQRPE